jgi:hypothetical protein
MTAKQLRAARDGVLNQDQRNDQVEGVIVEKKLPGQRAPE